MILKTIRDNEKTTTTSLGFRNIKNVTITSRYPKHPNVQEIIATIQQQSLQNHHSNAPSSQMPSGQQRQIIDVHVISGQTGIQDFCYLYKANDILVGNAMSTYVKWAAILGMSKVSKLYLYKPTLERLLSLSSSTPSSSSGATSNTNAAEDTNKVQLHDLIQMFGFLWTDPILKQKVQFKVLD